MGAFLNRARFLRGVVLRHGGTILCMLIFACLAAGRSTPARAQGETAHVQEGVASCAGSTCHGRQVASGVHIRGDELRTWQDPTGPEGAHSRAWAVLKGRRGQAIAARMGIGRAEAAPVCLACHADRPAPGQPRTRFQISDGVGCEACHGGAGDWLASHRALNATHAANVARGLRPLEDPAVHAQVCLSCRLGGQDGRFVTHEMMAAGHPRLSFELDLFTELQRHYDLDADYAARKTIRNGTKTWALGQTAALERALALYQAPALAVRGAFPEFTFFDCHSCHRRISDDPATPLTAEPNPGRALPRGFPPFNDENMIMLTAAAHALAPQDADRFDADARAFHTAFAQGREATVAAAARLQGSTQALEAAFAPRAFGRSDTMAILSRITAPDGAARYTDYAGGAQAVMAADTLVTALLAQSGGNAPPGLSQAVASAYAAVRDPNTFQPAVLRQALQRIGVTAGKIR